MQDIRAFVEEYVAAATGPDRERYLALFHDDAAVHDDGRSLRGLAEVRRWREETPNVDYDRLEVNGSATGCRAVAQVSGDFPGSPVTLRFAFERDARGKITVLTITP
ncbi:nuclear transport factor 2 family protein [Streptomyces sp. NPDC001599]|uniref:nuclear transport factor 2 family protein n=1 Tax=Streptomyces sp. NPDC001599 TaxID=3364591 RepID=UPI0036B8839F